MPRLLWLILAAAFVLSFGFAVTFGPEAPEYLVSDSSEYHTLAVSILTEHSYHKSLFRAPGYPAFLALVYLVAGARALWPVYLAQSLLLVVTLFLLYRISFHVTRDRQLSLLAVGLCAVWPPIWAAAGAVLTETLSGALVAASLWLLIKTMDRPTTGLSIGLGLAIGATALTKGPFLLFVPAAVVFIVLRHPESSSGQDALKDRLRRGGRASWRAGLVVLCAAAALVGPWTVRNYKLSGASIPVQTGAGMTLWMGNWPEYWRTPREFEGLTYPAPVEKLIRGKPEVVQERILARVAWGYIKEDPVRAVGIFLRKFSFLWLGALGADPRGARNPIPHIGHFGITKRSIVYVPLFFAAVLGWFFLPDDARKRAYPMMVLLLLWTVPYVLAVAAARYTVPVVCYEMLLAAVTAQRCFGSMLSKHRIGA